MSNGLENQSLSWVREEDQTMTRNTSSITQKLKTKEPEFDDP